MLNDHPRALSRLIALFITSVCLTFLVLCAYACALWNSVTRPCMDRVSLRLLVVALTFNLGFGLSFSFATVLAKETMHCAFLTFFANVSAHFNDGWFFSAYYQRSVNPAGLRGLVIVHKVNGQKMERFYYLGAGILATGCSVTPLAAGVFGWNEQSQSCWFVTRTKTETFRWSVATDSFWVPFMVAGEALAFLSIMTFFISYKIASHRNRSSSNTVDLADHYQSRLPLVKYRYTIIRIGLYPLVSCITNFSAALIDIHQLTHPVSWRLMVVALAIYGSRLTAHSLLAFTDPSLIRAAENIWHHMRPSTISSKQTSWSTLTQISTEHTPNATFSSVQVSADSEATRGNQGKAQDLSDDIGTQI
ncbi:hypothetical protein C8R45DRAFT_971043 [Mycena sanguinolenta]|nr:hypothetical protein C8R45DRAFT_971043 [Mycena sanguinolenta]